MKLVLHINCEIETISNNYYVHIYFSLCLVLDFNELFNVCAFLCLNMFSENEFNFLKYNNRENKYFEGFFKLKTGLY